jgi:hypothetical protein
MYLTSRAGGWTTDQFDKPSFMGVDLTWGPHLDLVGVRVDRRRVFRHHAIRAARKAAPRSLELRQLLEASRTVPAWVGLLLYKSLVRPIITYAAPLYTLSCDTSWRMLEEVERRGLRAALRARTDTPLDVLYRGAAAVRRLREEFERLADLFLLHHTCPGWLRGEGPQHPRLVRIDGWLERLLTCVPPADLPSISEWVRKHVEQPT